MGWFGGGNYNGPKAIRYLFIDGGCLREFITNMTSRYFGGATPDVDYARLTAGFTKVFYYDALPGRRASDTDASYSELIRPQRELFDKLSGLDRFHVYEGDVRRSSSRRPEQKKIDVMISVDMLTHSFRRNMHEATLLTGDLDFKPLIDALVLEGMQVTLWYPPGETAKELIASADSSSRLTIAQLHASVVRADDIFSLPAGLGEPSRGEFGTVLHRWQVEGQDYALRSDENKYWLDGPNANSGYRTYSIHSNLDLLRAWAADMVGVDIPPEAHG